MSQRTNADGSNNNFLVESVVNRCLVGLIALGLMNTLGIMAYI